MADLSLALFAVLPAVVGSPVGQATATFTADNHYALYTATGGVVSLIGGNETGAAGSPGGGPYPWSSAESYAFAPGDTIYVAVWSDNSGTQGLLGEIDLGASGWLRTGDLGWEVYNSQVPMGDGSAWPLPATIASWAQTASSTMAWKAPYVGAKNQPSTQPWGKIGAISPHAQWTWAPMVGGGGGNPMTTADNGATALLFRSVITVPAPGAAGLLAAAGLLVLPRRRR